MRFVISIVAALMILGLAAFGIVSAQKMSTTSSQATAASNSTADPAPATARRHPVKSRQPNRSTGRRTRSGALRRADAGGRGDARDGTGRSKCGTHTGGAGDNPARTERLSAERRGTAEARIGGLAIFICRFGNER